MEGGAAHSLHDALQQVFHTTRLAAGIFYPRHPQGSFLLANHSAVQRLCTQVCSQLGLPPIPVLQQLPHKPIVKSHSPGSSPKQEKQGGIGGECQSQGPRSCHTPHSVAASTTAAARHATIEHHDSAKRNLRRSECCTAFSHSLREPEQKSFHPFEAWVLAFCLSYKSSSCDSVENSKLGPSTIASTGHASCGHTQDQE